MADFKVYLLHCDACNQKTNSELWYFKTIYLNFNWTDFSYSSSFCVAGHWNFRYFTSGKRILPLMRSRPAVPYMAYLFTDCWLFFVVISCYIESSVYAGFAVDSECSSLIILLFLLFVYNRLWEWQNGVCCSCPGSCFILQSRQQKLKSMSEYVSFNYLVIKY